MTDRPAALRELRAALAKTQEEMGLRLGVGGGAVSLYENGKRPVPDPVWKLIQHERVALGDEW